MQCFTAAALASPDAVRLDTAMARAARNLLHILHLVAPTLWMAWKGKGVCTHWAWAMAIREVWIEWKPVVRFQLLLSR